MKILAETILANLHKANFPADFARSVKIESINGGVKALVDGKLLGIESGKYAVTIKRHKDDSNEGDAATLDASCSCPKRGYCDHIGIVYAVIKKVKLQQAELKLDSSEATVSIIDKDAAGTFESPPPGPLQILRLKAQNLMALEVFEVKFEDGAVVIFGGKNDIGKSTAVKSLAMALGGKRLWPDQPLRKGQTQGSIEVDLGDLDGIDGPLAELHVKCTFGKAESLIVTDAKGHQSKSPQALLNKLIGPISFDPYAFAKMDPAAQVEALQVALGLRERFQELDAQHDKAYDERREIRKTVKALDIQRRNLTQYADIPLKEISVSALMGELSFKETANLENQKLRDKLFEAKVVKNHQLSQIATLEQQLKEEKRKLKAATTIADDITSQVDLLQDENVEEIRTQITQADEINQKVRSNQKYAEISKLLETANGEEANRQEQLDKIAAEKTELVTTAKFSDEDENLFQLKKLSFGEDSVLYNGLPLSQAAFSETLRIGTAIALAAQKKKTGPWLNVVLIDQGSEFDKEHFAIIAEMAAKAGAQVLMTMIDPDAKDNEIAVHFVGGSDEPAE